MQLHRNPRFIYKLSTILSPSSVELLRYIRTIHFVRYLPKSSSLIIMFVYMSYKINLLGDMF